LGQTRIRTPSEKSSASKAGNTLDRQRDRDQVGLIATFISTFEY
jgi:hypothetical protein